MVIYLYFASFILEFCGLLAGVVTPLFLTEKLNATRFEVGFNGFLSSFAYTLTSLLTAKIHSQKRMYDFIYTPLLIGISMLMLPFLPKHLFFVVSFFMGIFYGRFWPSLQNNLRYYNDPKVTGNFNISWSIGAILGTFSGGFIYSFGYEIPYLVSGILCILVFPCLVIIKKIKSNNDYEQVGLKGIYWFSKKVVFEVRIRNFLSFFVLGGLSTLFPRYALELNISPPVISMLLTSTIIFRFLCFFIIRKKELINFESITFMFSVSTFFTLVLMSTVNNYLVYFFCFAVLGLWNGIVYHNSLIVHLRGNYPTEIHEGIIGAGLFTGPLICGLLGEMFNFEVAFIVIGFIVLVIPFIIRMGD